MTVQVDQTGARILPRRPQRLRPRRPRRRDRLETRPAGNRALARPPRRRGVDTFSLKGFGGAYEAITKACPAK